MLLATTLSYYKQPRVREQLVAQAADKEVAVRFAKGFGKRPDVLVYPSDVLELAKKGATSFHCSEEIWTNPLALSTSLRREDLDALRKGWDLILDIDTPQWVLSKLTAYLFIKALKAHGIMAVTCKFSGNKGFHIAVPAESFPERIGNQAVASLFPELPRKIALYLLHYIATNEIRMTPSREVIFGGKYAYPLEKLARLLGKQTKELFSTRCKTCKASLPDQPTSRYAYICPACGTQVLRDTQEEFIRCPSCASIITASHPVRSACKCEEPIPVQEFNAAALVDVDTILIAGRHLYRMPYSYHEKSGLISIPIDPARVLQFTKRQAEPRKTMFDIPFLDRSAAKTGEAARLLREAVDFKETSVKTMLQPARYTYTTADGTTVRQDLLPDDTEQIAAEFFPPAIKRLLGGLEDGRKRALFVLINFLQSVHWPYPEMEALIRQWNQKNKEPLKENYLMTQLNYARRRKKAKLPPNYDNTAYYKDLGLGMADLQAGHAKNPVQHARILARQARPARKHRRTVKDAVQKPAKAL